MGSRAETQRRREMEFQREPDQRINRISGDVIDAAFRVHQELGNGLLESVYEVSVAHELAERGYGVRRQVVIPVTYRNIRFDEGFRADLIVEDTVLVELKSVEALNKAHKKQVLSYLRLTGLAVGLLINFGSPVLRDGIHRIVNGRDI